MVATSQRWRRVKANLIDALDILKDAVNASRPVVGCRSGVVDMILDDGRKRNADSEGASATKTVHNDAAGAWVGRITILLAANSPQIGAAGRRVGPCFEHQKGLRLGNAIKKIGEI